ncbi:MAG TPA: hypothetical protein P5274_02610 [Candidatus Paceibacterota bacterium]|nr:hypothetical protein [Candidatus Paceibacterota bacterium]
MIKIKNIWQSRFFRGIIFTLAVVVTVLVIFQAGRFVGFRQASFSYRLGDNYYRAFEGPRLGGMKEGGMPFGDLPSGHGAVGEIIKVSLPTLIVSTPDNLEKTILLKEDTLIRHFREEVSSADLKSGDMVIVVGEPNQDSIIEAKLIRILPPAPLPRGEVND